MSLNTQRGLQAIIGMNNVNNNNNKLTGMEKVPIHVFRGMSEAVKCVIERVRVCVHARILATSKLQE